MFCGPQLRAADAAASSSSSFSASPSDVSESPQLSSASLSQLASPSRYYDISDDSEYMTIIPKIEEVDESDISRIAAQQPDVSNSAAIDVLPARPAKKRGRPPKLNKPENREIKGVKVRSKTGCITCRKRKKKCDERHPSCQNCELNNVICEGYPTKERWLNGQQRKELQERRKRWADIGPTPLPPFMVGIETEADRLFYEHWNAFLSKVLNLSPEQNNDFIVHLLPMAQAHQGLMHALLALAGAHYLLKSDNLQSAGTACISIDELEQRTDFHWREAVRAVGQEAQRQLNAKPSIHSIFFAFVFAIRSIVKGEHHGEWRKHINGVIELMLQHDLREENKPAFAFIVEFVRYHEMSSLITSLSPAATTPASCNLLFYKLDSANVDNFMRVCDGFDTIVAKIHNLRCRIRQRRVGNISPYVSYELMKEAEFLDAELRETEKNCTLERSTTAWVSWMLYYTSWYLWLQRTVMQQDQPGQNMNHGAAQAIEFLQAIPADSPNQALIVLPIFTVGICTYQQELRPAILEAFEVAENYSHNGNIDHGRRIVKRLWELMDAGDKRAWDYETYMIEEMGMDLLIT